MANAVLIGIDIGGSHIGVGFVDANEPKRGKLLCSEQTTIDPLTIDEGVILDVIGDLVLRLNNAVVGGVLIKAVGVGCPGQCIDGVLIRASNFPKILKADLAIGLRSRLQLPLDVPVVLLNDADAAVAAEVWGTAFMDIHPTAKNVAMITIGTGIGLGLILEGKVYQGSHGLVEGGHMIITPPNYASARVCPCGQLGCVESYASARSTAMRLSEAAFAAEKQSKYFDIPPDLDVFGLTNAGKSPGKSVTEVTGAKEVFARASRGDKLAQIVLEETYECVATLCINLCRVVDPDVIIIGGGMAQAGELFLSSVKDYFMRRSWAVMHDSVVLVLGSDSTQSGIIGAAMAARNQLQTTKSHSVTAAPSTVPVSSSSVSQSIEGVAATVSSSGLNAATNSSAPPSSSSSSSSGLLVMSIGLNLAVACSLLGSGKLSKADGKTTRLGDGILELTQGILLVLSQIGMGVCLYSKYKH